jgi:hypothetical protein
MAQLLGMAGGCNPVVHSIKGPWSTSDRGACPEAERSSLSREARFAGGCGAKKRPEKPIEAVPPPAVYTVRGQERTFASGLDKSCPMGQDNPERR